MSNDQCNIKTYAHTHVGTSIIYYTHNFHSCATEKRGDFFSLSITHTQYIYIASHEILFKRQYEFKNAGDLIILYSILTARR